jgi:hypothetical protein
MVNSGGQRVFIATPLDALASPFSGLERRAADGASLARTIGDGLALECVVRLRIR